MELLRMPIKDFGVIIRAYAARGAFTHCLSSETSALLGTYCCEFIGEQIGNDERKNLVYQYAVESQRRNKKDEDGNIIMSFIDPRM